ncbi:MAG: BofC C-terminal domain-containing protein [Syntrophomonadaceae bacterium]|jgi:hypothetical protein
MENKKGLVIAAAIIVIIAIGSGYILGDFFRVVGTDKKPVVEIGEKVRIIQANTPIVFKKEYQKCGHTIISEISDFSQRDILLGKDLETIRRIYSIDGGYDISWQGENLVIYQLVNEYCPADLEQYRLKEYQGMVAIYRGVKEEEVLERVTQIRIQSLPVSIQDDIRKGKYEFKDRATLNDVLENFDEY